MGRDVTMLGVFGTTMTVTSSDTAQSLPPSATEDFADAGINELATGALITVETFPVRIAWRIDPTSTFGHLLSVGDSIRVKDRNNLLRLRFINGTVGSNGVLMITPEFDK